VILVNGVADALVPAMDRGLAYGDGVFRTMRAHHGWVRHWDRHYDRLQHDCSALGIMCPPATEIEQDLAQVSADDCVVRITITRGNGLRGYRPGHANPTRIVQSSPVPSYPSGYTEDGVQVRLCRIRLASQPVLAGIKHLNRIENVLARSEWDDPEVAEGLLCDSDGNLIEGTMSNVFLLKDEILLTPDLKQCGVAGISRDRVIEAAISAGVRCEVKTLAWHCLLQADEVFLVNSVIGLWPIRKLVGYPERLWPEGMFSPQMRKWLELAAR